MADVTVAGARDASKVFALLQGAATCTAVTLLAFARMTGADPLFEFIWRSRLGSDLLFGILAAAAIATLSLVVAANRTPGVRAFQLMSHFGTSAAAVAIGSALLAKSTVNPAESLRFVGGPIAVPLLLMIAAANVLLWNRTRGSGSPISAKWPKELSYGFGATLSAAVVHLVSNAAGIESFAIQFSLILFGAVLPVLCFLTAFIILFRTKKLVSVAGMSAAAGSCAMLGLLAVL